MRILLKWTGSHIFWGEKQSNVEVEILWPGSCQDPPVRNRLATNYMYPEVPLRVGS